jgi:hypothetical protein
VSFSEQQYNGWRVNITEKCKEVDKETKSFYTTILSSANKEHKEEARKKVEDKIDGLLGLFGEKCLPSELRQLKSNFNNFAKNPHK